MSRATLPAAEHLLHRYGYHHLCSGVRATDIAVLDLEQIQASAYQQLLQECRAAISQDGAEAIVLGCAGMSDLATELSAALNVPVIDGVAAAVKLAESLHALKLTTSQKWQLRRATQQNRFHGRYQHWSR